MLGREKTPLFPRLLPLPACRGIWFCMGTVTCECVSVTQWQPGSVTVHSCSWACCCLTPKLTPATSHGQNSVFIFHFHWLLFGICNALASHRALGCGLGDYPLLLPSNVFTGCFLTLYQRLSWWLRTRKQQPRVLMGSGNCDIGTWDLDTPRNWHSGFERRVLPCSSKCVVPRLSCLTEPCRVTGGYKG